MKEKATAKKVAFKMTADDIEELKFNTEYLLDKGYACIDSGEYKDALDVFLADIKLNGESPDAVNGLGIALSEMGRYAAALDVLKKGVEFYHDDAITLANLASVYWETGNFELAVYYYQKSIECDNTIVDSYLNLINVYYEHGDLALAYTTALDTAQKFKDHPLALEIRDDILLDLAISCF